MNEQMLTEADSSSQISLRPAGTVNVVPQNRWRMPPVVS